MKIFHTADWHLGKLVQGVYMTEEQAYILEQFIQEIDKESPDVVIIAGDLYDRAVPPAEAVNLLDNVLAEIVLKRHIPVLSIAGNHDSPGRLNFGSGLMKQAGLHMVGQLTREIPKVTLRDAEGEVHFHLVPYADPSQVRYLWEDDSISSHQEAMKKIVEDIESKMLPGERHVFIGHAFVTPHGRPEENTSESERPLSIGGAEYVDAALFENFHYTALGHLHQAHFVSRETIRYAGSPLKYSISEEHHQKGYYIVTLDGTGNTEVEKRLLKPRKDLRTVEGYLQDILKQEKNEDFIFVRLLDETPILSPMEQIRTVYPNAMHVERKVFQALKSMTENNQPARQKMDDFGLFQAFYEEVNGKKPSEETKQLFQDILSDMLLEEREANL